MKQEVSSSKGGHKWEFTCEQENVARMKCRTCGLGVHQNYLPAKFDRLITHPCKEKADEAYFTSVWQIHPSHNMLYEGPIWRCTFCGRVLAPGGEKPHAKMLEICVPSKAKKAVKAAVATERTPASGNSQRRSEPEGRLSGQPPALQRRPNCRPKKAFLHLGRLLALTIRLQFRLGRQARTGTVD